MAMQFRKPKRNLRVRDSDGLQDNENEEKMDVDTVLKIYKPQKEKTIKKVNTLSFGDELNECDDGEEFKVKKSSYSKKIKKQMNKEKMGRDKVENGKKSKAIPDTMKPIINEKQTHFNSKPVEKEIMLTGRAAEMAGYVSSDEEPDSYSSSSHRFSNPDQVKIILKKGQIPDAALIHAARKRRQQARDLGEDFIPISSQSHNESNVDNEQITGRRLTREEDELEDSDDDGIIVMSGIVSQAEDRKKSLHTSMADHTNNTEFEDPDELDEDNDWETQQIRKAVTGSQLAAAQQESAGMSVMYNNMVIQEQAAMPISMNQKPRFPDSYAPQAPMTTMDIDDIINKSKEIVNEKKKNQIPDQKYYEDLINEIPEIKSRIEMLRNNIPGLDDCFQFYQDLRGYVTDLVECLDEKIPSIVGLEQRISKMYEKRRTDLVARRRQDVRDQAEESSTNKLGTSSTHTRSEEQQRRAAEREGRRIRRMRMREIKAISKHADGMSSDEEVPETDASAFRNQLEVIKSDSHLLLDDVLEEFASVDLVLKHMLEWKKKYLESYIEAYVNVCLPKLVGPFVRIEMLTWNPLEDDVKLEDMFWYKTMQKYTMKGNNNIDKLTKDVDLELIPKIIEKVVLIKIDQMVTSQWDPLSSKQTKHICSVVKHILDVYPTIDPDSKLLMMLMTNIVDRIRDAVDYDVFIPISSRQVMNTGRMNVFFQRQFNMAVKLLGNILSWHRIIEDVVLIDLAINQILNRYLLTSVRTLQPLEAILKITMIARMLPSSWLSYGNTTPKELTPFLNQSKLVSMEIDKSHPQAKLALDKLSEVLRL
ncbi:PREDICTED: PAX3- and PAX7-binding protein 1 isoform X1 [Diuraphis noxia]|uniref:PAX3- and PAX7-binding protein 1 isoform X1 n=2 Tax=Diuraphis noxia TaxID=143948 RepID=UPI00076373B4|nr:PREDICTED: PAX3- and PAX7-binding protein 1 isoform X1 [Diuraphis noxia]